MDDEQRQAMERSIVAFFPAWNALWGKVGTRDVFGRSLFILDWIVSNQPYSLTVARECPNACNYNDYIGIHERTFPEASFC